MFDGSATGGRPEAITAGVARAEPGDAGVSELSEIERLRRMTHLQTDLVMREVRLAEEAIGQRVTFANDKDSARLAAPARPTALIIPFPHRRRRPADH